MRLDESTVAPINTQYYTFDGFSTVGVSRNIHVTAVYGVELWAVRLQALDLAGHRLLLHFHLQPRGRQPGPLLRRLLPNQVRQRENSTNSREPQRGMLYKLASQATAWQDFAELPIW